MTRNKKVTVRLSDEEYAFLKANIEKSGLSQEAYLRVIISGRVPKPKPDEAFIKMVRELAAIGNNIHQLSAKANALGFIDAPMLEREMLKWREFRLAVRRHFLEPDKAGDIMGSPQSLLCGEKEQPRSDESFASQGESDKRRAL
jgi:hypothetical protein